nr:SprT family zinc-dependent metalloprotease [Oceaniglobus indicus]
MQEAVLPGTPPIGITLRKSTRARRISLRVSGLDGRVTLTLPPRVPVAEAMGFVRQKEDWIRRQLAGQPVSVTVGPGTVLPIDGRERRIEADGGRGVRLGDAVLHVPAGGQTGARVEGYLRQVARDRLAAASDRHAATLGVGYGRLTLRDTRSRWGSCSSQGDLMYSWRLILAPPDVLDYVAAHEIAHRVRMDHSAAFWAVVAQLMPTYDRPRGWLKINGAGLHRWRFRA